ncbi:MAG: hypothetical protein H8E14_03350 [Candidatus Marinimicrobia bacterium]|nr:hypothetical protein [Candidatus Neomarinimicrobiota bacterium]
MLKTVKILFGMLAGSMLVQASNSPVVAEVNHNGFSVSVKSSANTMIGFELRNYELQDVTEFSGNYKRLHIPDAGTMANEGEPYLPSQSTFYAVEPGKEYSITMTILESEIIRDINLIPHQGWQPIDETTPLSLKRNREIYFSARFPQDNAVVSAQLVLRDLHLVRVSFTPFIYYPLTQQLEIITKASLELVESGTSPTGFAPLKRSQAFEPLYRALVVNYDRYMLDIPYQQPSILYILPANTSQILATVNMLLDWRERSGYEVHQVSTATIGTQASAIKNYILNAYSTWTNPPEHVTFFGDASGAYAIPTWPETWSNYNGDGDHPYALLVGNDILPEVFLGRISFGTTTELATIISKTLQYETNPYMGDNWFNRALLVGDTSPSGISTIITNQYISMLMENSGYTDIRTIYGALSNEASQMVTELNSGMTFFNYRGYLGVSGFDASDVNMLTNGFKLPVMTFLTCGTGDFSSGTSLSESCVRAGNASNPKGAVAAVGTATLGTHTMFNNCVSMGFYRGIFTDRIETAGAALMRGKLQLYLTYPTNPNHYVEIFSHWNSLIGDSALRMWTNMPQRITVTAPSSIALGTNFIVVQVTSLIGGLPIEDALVTIRKGTNEIFESALTGTNGSVTLPINSVLSGPIDITVTKVNHLPYQSTLLLSNPANNINISQYPFIISDDNNGESFGNGDGLLNPGERVECQVLLQNYGTQAVNQVTARLVSDNTAVTFLHDSLFFGDIAVGVNNASAGNFVFELAEGLNNNLDLDFVVVISDSADNYWESNLNLSVSGTQLDILTMTVTAVGGILDPGETADLQIAIKNSGQIDATNVVGTLASPESGLIINDDEGSWDTIPVGLTVNNSINTFSVSADESVIPGTVVHLTLRLSTDNGYSITSIVPFAIGSPEVDDPTGPDSYGYYIYDSGDQYYSNAPFFNWIEINPSLGGPGSDTYLNDSGNNSDDVVTITLPFSFRMYGINYQDITVCSNGWIAMGATQMAAFRNYPIPGTAGPSPMIAAFWDDLKTTYGGKVYSWYDSDRYQYIIEWSNVRTYYNNDLESFQVILRDPRYYFTPTGDGEIIIQYLEFNNTSQTTSSATNHGNYATIGIEDHTGLVGLQYSFANQWAPTAMTLQDCTAIFMTTKGSQVRLRGDINNDHILDVFDVLGLIDFILEDNPGSINPYLADVNDDGVVNVLDMISVVQKVMRY